MRKLPVAALLDEKCRRFGLSLRAGESGLDRALTTSELNRPGLAFAGFLDIYTSDRMQVVGNTELAYLESLEPAERRTRLDKALAMDRNIPCVAVTDNGDAPGEMIEICERHGIPLLCTALPTTRFWSLVTFFLDREFAPTRNVHGVLVDVFGIGVLIRGSAGVGKSECGLELIERGHRLVADDTVIVKRLSKSLVVGSACATAEHNMEVRGLGIVDVELLFGAGSVLDEKRISLVVQLERWTDETIVDRLGMDAQYTKLLDVDVRYFEIPVEAGRNVAILCEVAALQHRINQQGRNPAQELNERLLKQMSQGE